MSGSAPGFAVKSDLAYTVVRNRILSNEYAPGSPFNQARLAVELGISTTPLREALRRLQSEGLVELGPHRDASVTGLSIEEARDLLEFRLAVDPLAAGLAAQRRTRDDIAAIRAASEIEALPEQPSIDQLINHRRFHQAVYAASHNDLLIATLDSLWDKSDRYRLEALRDDRDEEERRRKNAEHRELMLCVIGGDAAGATEVMRRHIQSSLGAAAVRRLGERSDP
ncbi:GntR family transcriptional regulator [Microbacterium sp. NPDC058345]|uniref:GntR family transcriptional regulator n=1 Tax=Microbacterium sp. NPDC058345 TaxID=3346455 RepID=UPI0036695B72